MFRGGGVAFSAETLSDIVCGGVMFACKTLAVFGAKPVGVVPGFGGPLAILGAMVV